MDEFAFQRTLRYATTIIEPARNREGIRLFFARLGPERCAVLEAVVIDMNGAFEQEVRAQAAQDSPSTRGIQRKSRSAMSLEGGGRITATRRSR